MVLIWYCRGQRFNRCPENGSGGLLPVWRKWKLPLVTYQIMVETTGFNCETLTEGLFKMTSPITNAAGAACY